MDETECTCFYDKVTFPVCEAYVDIADYPKFCGKCGHDLACHPKPPISKPELLEAP